ncbi:MAG: CBS domain-containing protein [bacterium]|nr:CBS domain-containing protein [bacterium]
MTVRWMLDGKPIGRQVFTVRADATLVAATQKLAEHRIGALLVVSEENNDTLGIISERVIVRKIAECGHVALGYQVHQAMTPKEALVTCTASDTTASIMEQMTTGKFRHMPVLNEYGQLAGMISIGDVVNWRLIEIDRENRAMKDYIRTA